MSDNNVKHPVSNFNSQYPYNWVWISRAGHEIHVNDTPGSESLKIAHTIGTYFEIDSQGRMVTSISGKAYEYFTDGHSVTVDGHEDIKIVGSLNINVDNSISEQTAGNKYSAVGGDKIDGVSGSSYDHTGGDKYQTVSGEFVQDVTGNHHVNVEGDDVRKISGTKTEILSGDWSTTSSGSIELQNDGTFRIKCKNFIVEAETITLKTQQGELIINTDLLLQSVGSLNISTGGTSNVASTGNFNVTAPIINLNTV